MVFTHKPGITWMPWRSMSMLPWSGPPWCTFKRFPYVLRYFPTNPCRRTAAELKAPPHNSHPRCPSSCLRHIYNYAADRHIFKHQKQLSSNDMPPFASVKALFESVTSYSNYPVQNNNGIAL